MPVYTIKLKLHNPSRHKRQIIDEAMISYSRAYQYLLDKAYNEIEYIRENFKDKQGKYKATYIVKWIGKDTSKELNMFNIEPFKDSLKIDFATTLAGYLNLKNLKGSMNFPVAYVQDEELDKKNDMLSTKLIKGQISLQEFQWELNKYMRKNQNLKPLFFCRYSKKRNYSLLHDPKNNRFFAKIYLLNAKNAVIKSSRHEEHRQLIYIDKERELFKRSAAKECFIIVPLSFGKWQEEHLRKAMLKPEILKTARLVKRNDEYYLSINIDEGETEIIKTSTYMGVARGIVQAVNYSVVDEESNLILSDKAHIQNKSKAISDNDIHGIANTLVKTALENKSQIIMQKLIDKGDKLQWRENNKKYLPILSCRDYNRLYAILKYKLCAAGLPPPLRVSATSIFYTCPCCGMNTKRNRFSSSMFMCTMCGTVMNIEEVGSLNLSKKLIQYKNETIKIKVDTTPEGLKFSNADLGLEFYPANPFDCREEFKNALKKLINDFYENMNMQLKNKQFKKKYSLIKKLDDNMKNDIFKIIQVEE